jgi:uncharacterized lipoprotein YmbA
MAMSNICGKGSFRVAASTIIAALMISGCGGRSQPTQFYMLASTVDTHERLAGSEALQTKVIGIGPVTLADYLARTNIITRPGEHRIDRAKFDQWAGSLSSIVTNVLADNLGQLIGTQKVAIHPWRSPIAVDYQVIVDISRFDGKVGGSVILSARWAVIRSAESSLVIMKTSSIAEPVTGSGYEGLAAAQSRALKRLSTEMAQAIVAAPS